MDELKPCPFCGGEGEIYSYHAMFDPKERVTIRCKTCGGNCGVWRQNDIATLAWNRREESVIEQDPTLIDEEAEARRIEKEEALRMMQELYDELDELLPKSVKLYELRKSNNLMRIASLLNEAHLRAEMEL